MMADVAARNYPAMRLLMKTGFTFCGYNDRCSRDNEVAVFFAAGLREGSLREGSLREGSLREGSLREGSLREGSLREGSLREGGTR